MIKSNFLKIMWFFLKFRKNDIIFWILCDFFNKWHNFSIYRKNHMIFKKIWFITKHYHAQMLHFEKSLNLEVLTGHETEFRPRKILKVPSRLSEQPDLIYWLNCICVFEFIWLNFLTELDFERWNSIKNDKR